MVCYIVWSNYTYLPCPGKTAELICVGYREAGLIDFILGLREV